MEATIYWLRRRDGRDLKDGAPAAVYRAEPGIGVFESEAAFLDYLRRHYAPKYGDCFYMGIRGERERPEPRRIYRVNYEIVPTADSKARHLTGADLEAGTAAVVTSPGVYAGHLVLKTPHGVQSITDASVCWEDGGLVGVRLLAPGEAYQIRGR